MKNKVLKIAGIGALSLVAMTTLAGCGMNNEQMKLLEDKVTYFEQYAEETNQKLADANLKLDEQNNLIKEQSNLINQQMLVDRAWGLIQTAQAKLIMNIDGVRDNLVIENTAGGQSYTQEFYKTQSGDYIYTGYQGGSIVYEDSTGVYRYSPTMEDGDSDKKREMGYSSIEACFADESIFNVLVNFDKSNIMNVEIMTNGDYKISIVHNRKEGVDYASGSKNYAMIIDMVISTEGKYISCSVDTMSIQKWEDPNYVVSYITLDSVIKFKYGAVNIEEVLTQLAEAKAYPVS